jgi:hypothetical protein
MQIYARTLTEKTIELDVKQYTTIAEVKEKIERKGARNMFLKQLTVWWFITTRHRRHPARSIKTHIWWQSVGGREYGRRLSNQNEVHHPSHPSTEGLDPKNSLSEISSTYDQYFDQPKNKVSKGQMLQATSDRLAGLDEDAEATFDRPQGPEKGEEPTLEQNSTDRQKHFTKRRNKRKFISDLFASRRTR